MLYLLFFLWGVWRICSIWSSCRIRRITKKYLNQAIVRSCLKDHFHYPLCWTFRPSSVGSGLHAPAVSATPPVPPGPEVYNLLSSCSCTLIDIKKIEHCASIREPLMQIKRKAVAIVQSYKFQ